MGKIIQYPNEEADAAFDRFEEKLDYTAKMVGTYGIEPLKSPLGMLCKNCELWNGKNHDYTVCEKMPCYRLFLGYTYAMFVGIKSGEFR